MNTRSLSAAIILLLLQSLASFITANQNVTNSQDLTQQLKNETAIEGRTQESNFSEKIKPSGVKESKRGGRMLDLDRLEGIEKLTKERSLSGQRQSRILTEDLLPGAVTSKSSKKLGSKKKKMTIKGFIPIVSLEHAKGGKQFADEEEEEEEESEAADASGANAAKEQLMSGFGGQTSIGHASFGIQPQQQPEQSQWQQVSSGSQLDGLQQEAARANRKLLGSSGILSNLAAPSKRFVSTLVPQQQSQQLQAPMNIPLAPGLSQQQEGSDCICVPFFQCKNGFLPENKLARGQLNQFTQQPNAPQMIQVPRTSLNQQSNYEMFQNLRQQAAEQQQANPMSSEQQNLVNDLIYEQLRKSIESGNLDAQVAMQQQQGAFMQLDERSKADNSSASDTEERSLLNQLGRRNGNGNHRNCGIMRTCCRIPAHLVQAHQNRFGQQHQQAARLVQPQARPQPQYQLLQPAQAYQVNPPQLPPPHHVEHPADFHQLAPSSSRPVISGNFMAGRCGTRQTLGISGRVQNAQPAPGSETTAEFGEFPSHVAILKKMSPGDSMFVCSAVLISNQWLATAAHCIRKHRLEELKVRLGEWDVNRDDEFYPYVESAIREIIIHPDFQPSSLINDPALLRLEQPMDAQQMPHIAPACLPTASEEPFSGQRCWVTGWGKDAFGQQGTFQSVLKKVDLPVVGRQECENALRYQTKLGRYFRLHQSAMCAGGERGKDACEGDGGAGLYCTDAESGLTRVIGLVSWGVGCGQRGVPGVYTNLATLSPWIEQVVAGSGEENLYLDTRSNALDSQFKNIISERSNQNATTAAAALQLNATTTGAPEAGAELDSDLESRAG